MGTHNLPHLMIALIGCSLLALALASSHSEAPGTAKGPRADLTDVYAFKSRETGRGDYVALVMNVGGLQQSQAGPNYNPLDTDFVYQFRIDNNGDAVEDLTFQFVIGERFNNDGQGLVIPVTLGGETRQVPVALNHIGQVDETQATLNLQQYYRVRLQHGADYSGSINDGPWLLHNKGGGAFQHEFEKAYENAGEKTFPLNNYTEYVENLAIYRDNVRIPGCSQRASLFVGPRRESFGIPLGQVFDLVNLDPTEQITSADDDSIGVWSSVRPIAHHPFDENGEHCDTSSSSS